VCRPRPCLEISQVQVNRSSRGVFVGKYASWAKIDPYSLSTPQEDMEDIFTHFDPTIHFAPELY
jgi:hypothetical protein